MQWLVTILVVLSALALLAMKLYRFGRELTRGDSGEDFKPRCGGCPGATKSESELGITIKPLVQIGDKTKNAGLALVVLLSCLGGIVVSQEIRPPNYDESKASGFELVSVLAGPDGKAIQSKEQWPAQRSYLVNLLATQEYGFAPKETVAIRTEVFDDGPAVLGGETRANIRRRQIAVFLERNGKQVRVDLALWSPKDRPDAPCFLGLNFRGNQSTCDDPKIRLTTSWCDKRNPGVVDNKATEASRANQSERWPIAEIVAGGYAVATAHYSDIDPDYDDGFENGVHGLFPEHRIDAENPSRWGSIAAWAWGLSRLADVLEKLDGIDPKGLMVVGHSRLGKTALWAGATDARFALVVSNNSGCGGAALSKRIYGESVARINTSFPHWFNRNFRKYNDREELLEFDQHQLIAAIAPRPVYIASASNDQWADPLGELLSGYHASSAYRLLGKQGLDAKELPAVNTPIGQGAVGYHLRQGEHDMLLYDWQQFMAFAKRNGL
ncbi:MAG: acetylxylan esterase [Pirellula sp.]